MYLRVHQVAVGSELRRGDVLTKINGRPCSEMTHREAAEMIKNAGTTITVTVHRYYPFPYAVDPSEKPCVQRAFLLID